MITSSKKVYFYSVAPASSKYFGAEALTYSSDIKISLGAIVEVEFNNNICYGIVIADLTKPDFPTKGITAQTQYALEPQALLFMKSIISYYPNPIGPLASLFLPKKLYPPKDTTTKVTSPNKVELSSQQENAVDKINKSTSNTILLHGITGSGKTRIYTYLALS